MFFSVVRVDFLRIIVDYKWTIGVNGGVKGGVNGGVNGCLS